MAVHPVVNNESRFLLIRVHNGALLFFALSLSFVDEVCLSLNNILLDLIPSSHTALRLDLVNGSISYVSFVVLLYREEQEKKTKDSICFIVFPWHPSFLLKR